MHYPSHGQRVAVPRVAAPKTPRIDFNRDAKYDDGAGNMSGNPFLADYGSMEASYAPAAAENAFR